MPVGGNDRMALLGNSAKELFARRHGGIPFIVRIYLDARFEFLHGFF